MGIWRETCELPADERPELCFLCGRHFPVDLPIVFWHGSPTYLLKDSTPFIGFCPSCVPTFCRALLMDWEAAMGKNERLRIER